jgi:hypothetical protein
MTTAFVCCQCKHFGIHPSFKPDTHRYSPSTFRPEMRYIVLRMDSCHGLYRRVIGRNLKRPAAHVRAEEAGLSDRTTMSEGAEVRASNVRDFGTPTASQRHSPGPSHRHQSASRYVPRTRFLTRWCRIRSSLSHQLTRLAGVPRCQKGPQHLFNRALISPPCSLGQARVYDVGSHQNQRRI